MASFNKILSVSFGLKLCFLSSFSFAQTQIEQAPIDEPSDTVSIENPNDDNDPQFAIPNNPNGYIEEPIIIEQTTVTTVRALDKITAHITELDLPQGEMVQFGTLQITARTCSSRPPEEIPETFAFIEIDDLQRNDTLVRVFTGWMMASSPALNALEHPGYDIWVISCKIVEGVVASESE